MKLVTILDTSVMLIALIFVSQANATDSATAGGRGGQSFAERGAQPIIAPLSEVVNPVAPIAQEFGATTSTITTSLSGMGHHGGKGHPWWVPPPPKPEAEAGTWTWAMTGIGLVLLGAFARRQ